MWQMHTGEVTTAELAGVSGKGERRGQDLCEICTGVSVATLTDRTAGHDTSAWLHE